MRDINPELITGIHNSYSVPLYVHFTRNILNFEHSYAIRKFGGLFLDGGADKTTGEYRTNDGHL